MQLQRFNGKSKECSEVKSLFRTLFTIRTNSGEITGFYKPKFNEHVKRDYVVNTILLPIFSTQW